MEVEMVVAREGMVGLKSREIGAVERAWKALLKATAGGWRS